MEPPNHKLCPFGYITIDSNNFLWMLSLVIVCVLWLTWHVGRWWGKRNWCKEKNWYTIVKRMHKDSNVDSFVSKIETPLYDEPNVMWAYVALLTKINIFLLIKHQSSNNNFGICYLEIKYPISRIFQTYCMKKKLKNESSSKYKERIFMKILAHYHWVGTIYLYGI
jgi:hypothetical protein